MCICDERKVVSGYWVCFVVSVVVLSLPCRVFVVVGLFWGFLFVFLFVFLCVFFWGGGVGNQMIGRLPFTKILHLCPLVISVVFTCVCIVICTCADC